MPYCFKCNRDMVRVNQGTEIMGEGWKRVHVYWEDYMCEKCKFRVRQRYQIINLGGG